mgnify:CR=1 FL=1
MSQKKDTVKQTIFIALILSLVCSVIVSFAAVMLKPIQEKNKSLDRKTNILKAAGLFQSAENVEKIFSEKVKMKLVNLKTGQYVEGVEPEDYDQYKMARDAEEGLALEADVDIAGIKNIAKKALVYEVLQNGKISLVVLPIHGKGLWSTLYGFMAVQADSNTIQGLGFYEHGETPGLGGEVDNPRWKAQWKGKKLHDKKGVLKIEVIKGVVDTKRAGAIHQVDGLSGATITARGVSHLVRFWLGEQGFAKYLQLLKRKQGA